MSVTTTRILAFWFLPFRYTGCRLRPRRHGRNPHLGMKGAQLLRATKVWARLDGQKGEQKFNGENFMRKRPDGLDEPWHTIRFVSEVPGKSHRTKQGL